MSTSNHRLCLVLVIKEIFVRTGGKTISKRHLRAIVRVICGESPEDALLYDDVVVRNLGEQRVNLNDVLEGRPDTGVWVILGFGTNYGKEFRITSPLVRRPKNSGGPSSRQHHLVDMVVPPHAFRPLVTEQQQAGSVPRPLLPATVDDNNRRSRGHPAGQHRSRREQRQAASLPAYDNYQAEFPGGENDSSAAGTALAPIASAPGDASAAWTYSSAHQPQYPSAATVAGDHRTSHGYGASYGYGNSTGYYPPPMSASSSSQPLYDFDWADGQSQNPPVPWNQIESYRSFQENKAAHDFWKWDREAQKWKHVDEDTGEIIYCPDELD